MLKLVIFNVFLIGLIHARQIEIGNSEEEEGATYVTNIYTPFFAGSIQGGNNYPPEMYSGEMSIKDGTLTAVVNNVNWILPKNRGSAFKKPTYEICMPYVPRVEDATNEYNYNHSCTGDHYIKTLWEEGKHDCSFKQLVDVDFPGQDDLMEENCNYHKTFEKCSQYNCIGFIHQPSTKRCWLKNANHLTMPKKQPKHFPGLVYWYATCEQSKF